MTFRSRSTIAALLLGLFLAVQNVSCQLNDATCTKNDETTCQLTKDQDYADDSGMRSPGRDSLMYDYDSCVDCRDEDPQCPELASKGYCDGRAEYNLYVKTRCRKSCENYCEKGLFDWGLRQNIPNEDTWVVVVETLDYINNYIVQDEEVIDCKNRDKRCSYWASINMCDVNQEFMDLHCAAACLTCDEQEEPLEEQHVDTRCTFDPTAPRSLYNGDLNKLFHNITTDASFQKRYNPTVLSQPSNDPDTDGPWIVMFEDFLNETECQALIDAGKSLGFGRSTAVVEGDDQEGEADPEVSDYRTSSTAWCEEECVNDNPAIQTVWQRITNLTGVPFDFSESMQLLQYTKGQYYKVHGDFLDMDVNLPQGPRALTLLMYLNNVEEGGETSFPHLRNDRVVTIAPRRGRAVLWPSGFNHDLFREDHRTEHEALPVREGIKFGANVWLHVGNVLEADARDCR